MGDIHRLHIFEQVIFALMVIGATIGYAVTRKDPSKKKLSRYALLGAIFGAISFLWPYIFGW
jgi:hypothetical protein